MKYRLFILLLVTFLMSSNAYSLEQCLDVFPGAEQELGPKLDLPNFKKSNKNDGDQEGSNLALPAGQYDDVKVDDNGLVFFTELDAEYRMKKLSIGTGATAIFVAGDYWIDDFKMKDNSTLAVDGAGTVRIYAKKIDIGDDVRINDANGLLILISYGDIKTGENLSFTGVMYAKDDIKIDDGSTINGSITGDKVDINSPSDQTYQEDSVTDADFDGMCDRLSFTPIASYRFDECFYTGNTGDVIDEIGSFPGQSFSTLDTSVDAQIERSANITDAYHHIETSIPISGDFSVSTWFKKPSANSGNRYLVLGAMANGDGDLLYLDRNRNYRWGVYDGSGSSNGSFRFGTLTGGWHHLALVYSGNRTTLFIDGDNKGSVGRRPTGTFKYIGTSYDDVNGANPQGFRTPLDEFKVFDKELSDTEIIAIYDNELAGKNYDNTTRTPVNCLFIEPIVEYRLEQSAWSGTLGEVIDEQGNLHGTAYNDATPIFTNPAIPTDTNNQGTCAYGAFDGNGDYVQIDHDARLNLPTALTVSTWVNTNVIPGAGLKTILSKDENFEFHINSSAEIFWWWGTNSFSTTDVNIIPGTWYHIALTYRSGEQVIYVNGVPRASRAFTGNLPLNTDPLQIGQDQNFAGRYFDGFIDEVRIYDQALTPADILTIYNDTHLCSLPQPTLYQIQHDGSGLTCSPEPVTIRACSNASCSSYDNSVNKNVVLMVDGITKTITVANGISTNETFVYTDPINPITLSLTTDYVCLNTVDQSNSCQLTFADTGFRFLADGQPLDIPRQLSAKPSDIGFDKRTLALQAVTKNPVTGVCEAALIDDVVIEISVSCSIESNCANKNVQIKNAVSQISTPITPTNNGVANVYVPVALNFGDDTSNAAAFVFTYPDAGKMNLNVRYNLPDENGDPSGNFMTGSSNGFVVRPLGFYLDIPSNPAAVDASGSVFKKAGEDFIVNSSAVVWQQSDDVNNDGIPDTNSGLADNAITVNFGSETSTQLAKLSLDFVAPTLANGGVLGMLSVTDFTAFVNGNSAITTNYSEVGVVSFSQNLNNNSYLGADDITGLVANVGRFTPAYFEQVIVDTVTGVTGGEGTIVANHNNSASCEMLDWAYSGQKTGSIGSIQYGVEPKLTITPYNVSGVPVLNYFSSFAKLVTDLSDTTVQIGGPNTLHSNGLPLSGVLQRGVMTELNNRKIEYSLSPQDNFTYSRNTNSKVAPFNAHFELPINGITDSDSITLRPTSGGVNYFENPIFYQTTSFNNTLEIRFGRWLIENTYGPETTNLPVKMSAEQFDGSKFIANSDENCLTPMINSKKSTGAIGSGGLVLFDYRLIDTDVSDNLSPNDTDASISGNAFTDGLYREFIFSAPNSVINNNPQGTLHFEYEVPSWLKYDWLQLDGSYDDNPNATVTFGRYRGNDRIIYWREN